MAVAVKILRNGVLGVSRSRRLGQAWHRHRNNDRPACVPESTCNQPRHRAAI